MRLLGAVLAGGQSRRFGSDKAVAMLHGKPLIDHVIEALAAQTEAVIICGREYADWVPDRPRANLGPLGGINAALNAAAQRGYAAVLTAPCDVPELPADLAVRLGAGGFAAEMPVIGLWPVALAPVLDAFLAESDDRSVWRWARRAGVPQVAIDRPLLNINTPDDLRTLGG